MWKCTKCETLNDSNENTCLICGFGKTDLQAQQPSTEPVAEAIQMPYNSPVSDLTEDNRNVPDAPADNQQMSVSDSDGNDSSVQDEQINNSNTGKKADVGKIIKTVILVLVLLGLSAGIFMLIYSALKSETSDTVSRESISCEQLI